MDASPAFSSSRLRRMWRENAEHRAPTGSFRRLVQSALRRRARTEFVVQAESLGFPTAWLGFGQASISDLALVERVLDATTKITVATAIVNMWNNDAAKSAEAYQPC